MFTSRPLQVLLLLTCGITAVPAAPPNAVFGAGVKTCKEFVQAVEDQDKDREMHAFMILSWVQGYFSARNIGGRLTPFGTSLKVGGSMSPQTLQAMLVDECNEDDFKPRPVFLAVDALYNKLQAKGL